MKLMKLGTKKRDSRSAMVESGSFPVSFPPSFRSPERVPTSPIHTKNPTSSSNQMQFSLSLIPAVAKSQVRSGQVRTVEVLKPGFPEHKNGGEDENDENMEFLKRLERHSRRSQASSSLLKPGNYLDPPREVTIDPNAVPPSPMRDPNMSAQKSQERKPLANLSNSPRRIAPPELGEPLGDIGMKTQLWDAQRLVRVILGKAQSDQSLESGSILQAIRTFALMKAELVQLRKCQEHQDPPTIMPLPSPSTCNTSSYFELTPKKHELSLGGANTPQPADIHRKAIIEAAKKIQALEKSLVIAAETNDSIMKERAETNHLLEQARHENVELRERIQTNNLRLSRYREQSNKAIEQKDFRISKLERSNIRLQTDANRVLDTISKMNQTAKGSGNRDVQQVIEAFRVAGQAPNISPSKQ